MLETVVSECGGFEWDSDKAASNLTKHGVSFEEAVTVLSDVDAHVDADALDPTRVNVIGFSNAARVLYVVAVERVEADRIRIISARKATKQEAKRLGK